MQLSSDMVSVVLAHPETKKKQQLLPSIIPNVPNPFSDGRRVSRVTHIVFHIVLHPETGTHAKHFEFPSTFFYVFRACDEIQLGDPQPPHEL